MKLSCVSTVSRQHLLCWDSICFVDGITSIVDCYISCINVRLLDFAALPRPEWSGTLTCATIAALLRARSPEKIKCRSHPSSAPRRY